MIRKIVHARLNEKVTEFIHVGVQDIHYRVYAIYSRSSRKRPPRESEKVVVSRAGHLQEYSLVSDPMVEQ